MGNFLYSFSLGVSVAFAVFKWGIKLIGWLNG